MPVTLEADPAEGTLRHLGPARVLALDGNRALIKRPDQHVWAILALGGLYQLAVDDEVLAIGQDGSWYVIGLIQGRGRMALTVPRDLVIRAPQGRIELSAAKGFSVKSPIVTIAAVKLEILARSVFERFSDATRWVKEVFQLRAGRVRTRVDGDYDLCADRIVEVAENDVKIDGSKIHLG